MSEKTTADATVYAHYRIEYITSHEYNRFRKTITTFNCIVKKIKRIKRCETIILRLLARVNAFLYDLIMLYYKNMIHPVITTINDYHKILRCFIEHYHLQNVIRWVSPCRFNSSRAIMMLLFLYAFTYVQCNVNLFDHVHTICCSDNRVHWNDSKRWKIFIYIYSERNCGNMVWLRNIFFFSFLCHAM